MIADIKKGPVPEKTVQEKFHEFIEKRNERDRLEYGPQTESQRINPEMLSQLHILEQCTVSGYCAQFLYEQREKKVINFSKINRFCYPHNNKTEIMTGDFALSTVNAALMSPEFKIPFKKFKTSYRLNDIIWDVEIRQGDKRMFILRQKFSESLISWIDFEFRIREK